ncbi:MAG: glycosyltransferase [Alphaproteobacteria bacterium]|nr:glycosyltransferase [Alphaproteobacteria bacterium]
MSTLHLNSQVWKERQRQSSGSALAPLLLGRLKFEFILGCIAWAASFLYFWVWWFEPGHNIGSGTFAYVTILQAWITFLPGYFLLIFFSGKKPAGPGLPPGSARVAMVVTKAPSEPFAVVQETLLAMLAQDYPHDTWLADENPDQATRDWCASNGVHISTRYGIAEYHRSEWPRRTRCKEGNLAYFYDTYGYGNYDFVSQLDADHVPSPTYLREMMRPFTDSSVGYVSAPSICDKNEASSWAARGRLYFEATMHGAMQAGYNGGWAPLCIGSHYAVRTKALKDIGGLGPELAEDHSTTLLMNAHGWHGVHAIDAIAHGDGPETFSDLITQEFQWSRSLVMIMLKYMPIYARGLPGHLRFQFLFSQLWYPFFAIFMGSAFLLPILAVFMKVTFVDVTYPEFVMHVAPMAIVLTIVVMRMRGGGLLRPASARLLSWELPVFLFAKWPWVLFGTTAAIWDWAAGSFVDFKVTPKGTKAADPLPPRVLAPYAFLSVASAIPVILVDNAQFASGFYIFGLMNALIYGGIFLLALIKHQLEKEVHDYRLAYKFGATFASVSMLAAILFGIQLRGLRGLDAVSYGIPYFELTDRTFPVSGAGQGGAGNWAVSFHPHWVDESELMLPGQPLEGGVVTGN